MAKLTIADAATERIEEGYRAVAARLWAEQHDNELWEYHANGRLVAISKAITLLVGKPHKFVVPPPFYNGMMCVAVNLLGEGLYRIYQGGTTIYYRW